MPRKKKSTRAERLTLAAQRLFHRQGIGAVSLRDVARAARVPAGGVFYHFPTKGALVLAAAEARREAVTALLADLERRYPDPGERLVALCAALGEAAGAVSRHGCPMTRMIAELGAARGPEADAREAMRATLDELTVFVVRLVRESGRSPGAARRAGERFLADWQGAIALSLARQDREVLLAALARLSEELLSPRARRARKNRPETLPGG